MKNMLIPSDERFDTPDFEIYNLGHIDFNSIKSSSEDKTLDDCLVTLDLEQNKALIFGTKYAGEMKKSVLTVMMHHMPNHNNLPMHASANISKDNDNLTLFFGLSGTGKTSLSTATNRNLIGDDEHVWHNNGVFNIEGGCYAKCVDLDREKEPEIYNAIRYNAIMENVAMDTNGEVDYGDVSLTQNTRTAYPLQHVQNVLLPAKTHQHPTNIPEV
jgi:phosphoenolpyruvate carboxykinase (ATP)